MDFSDWPSKLSNTLTISFPRIVFWSFFRLKNVSKLVPWPFPDPKPLEFWPPRPISDHFGPLPGCKKVLEPQKWPFWDSQTPFRGLRQSSGTSPFAGDFRACEAQKVSNPSQNRPKGLKKDPKMAHFGDLGCHLRVPIQDLEPQKSEKKCFWSIFLHFRFLRPIFDPFGT